MIAIEDWFKLVLIGSIFYIYIFISYENSSSIALFRMAEKFIVYKYDIVRLREDERERILTPHYNYVEADLFDWLKGTFKRTSKRYAQKCSEMLLHQCQIMETPHVSNARS